MGTRHPTLSFDGARKFCDDIDALTDEEFSQQVEDWSGHSVPDVPAQYESLRDELVRVFDETYVPGARGQYRTDLEIGLALYRLLKLSGQPSYFSELAADDDDFWRFLTIRVIPDLTYLRYPAPERNNEGRLARKRFFAHTRRIWAKTLWWYIHLSWQGDEEATRETLSGFGSDTISQLYERPGKGYRIDFTRQLMKDCALRQNSDAETFKKIRKQNTVDFKTVEPGFVLGGEAGYVEQVLNLFDEQENPDVH